MYHLNFSRVNNSHGVPAAFQLAQPAPLTQGYSLDGVNQKVVGPGTVWLHFASITNHERMTATYVDTGIESRQRWQRFSWSGCHFISLYLGSKLSIEIPPPWKFMSSSLLQL